MEQKTFDLQRYLKEGWALFTANAANLVVATLILLAVQFAASYIPLAGLLVSGPMMGGMFYVIFDLMEGKGFAPARMFDGFKKFVPLVLVGILTGIFTGLGFLLLILPGFLVAGWYIFSYLLVVDEDLDFWPAMEKSRAIGFENHLNVFLLVLVLMVVNLIGVLAIGVGLLVSIPLTFCITVKAYEDIVGIKSISLAAPAPTSFAPPPPPPPPPPSPVNPQ